MDICLTMSEAQQVAKTHANFSRQSFTILATHAGLFYVAPSGSVPSMSVKRSIMVRPDPILAISPEQEQAPMTHELLISRDADGITDAMVVTDYQAAYDAIEAASPEQRAHILHCLSVNNPEARRFIIAVSTQTDPYILEQAYDADEAADHDPNHCPYCDSYEPCDCFEEPEEAGLVTGWVDGRASYE